LGVSFLARPLVVSAAMNHHGDHGAANAGEQQRCPNCGMVASPAVPTRFAFTLAGASLKTCSLHCLAELAQRAGEAVSNAQAGLFLEPGRMVPAAEASYVIGSAAEEPMSAVSKVAFPSQAAAAEFAAKQGGEVVDFPAALARATAELDEARARLAAKRQQNGRLTEPGPEVGCANCGMFPARYPEHRSQLRTSEKQTHHFCSTRCLVLYLQEKGGSPEAIWVTLHPDGGMDYAPAAYYVVGSSLMGPMGPEAFAYRTRPQALAAAAEHGGRVARFDELAAALGGKSGIHHGMKGH